jgi:hypothetical protein
MASLRFMTSRRTSRQAALVTCCDYLALRLDHELLGEVETAV